LARGHGRRLAADLHRIGARARGGVRARGRVHPNAFRGELGRRKAEGCGARKPSGHARAEALVGFEVDPVDVRIHRDDGGREVVAVVDQGQREDRPVEVCVDVVIVALLVGVPITETPGQGGRNRIGRLWIRRLPHGLMKPHGVDEGRGGGWGSPSATLARPCRRARNECFDPDGLVEVKVELVARFDVLCRPAKRSPRCARERGSLQIGGPVNAEVDVDPDGRREATALLG